MKSEFIAENLMRIERSLSAQTFIDVERSKIELKDLSTGASWDSLKSTLCAFLNTEGGIVFCGIREEVKPKKYIVTGFNRNDEPKIIELHTRCFQNDNDTYPDLSEQIYFDYYSLADKEILAIAVFPLSDDKKFVSFKKKYYERKLTQDKEIPVSKITRQQEYKAELEYAKELMPVEGAQLADLSLDKINNYVQLLNKEIRNETTKQSLTRAKEFLSKQHFIKGEHVVTLGMLVCGADPFYFLGERVGVDYYYDTSSDIGKDKKIFRNDVISLMEDAFRYVWGHIKISRTIKDGGKGEPEYPEKMIREVINNALAHRDYTINRFVTVVVEPNQYIEIKNPGFFKEKMKLVHTDGRIPIRRLIPGIPESKNPKLASVLKVFDKIESQGRGMASLVNAALDNLIDLPYYEIKQDNVTLRVPTGKLVDESIDVWLNGFNRYILHKLKDTLTPEHKAVLAYFYKSELRNRERYFTILLTESNNHLGAIEDLKKAGLILEHECSDDLNAVYVLDSVLCQTHFGEEIMMHVGTEYIHYHKVAKEILNIAYLFTRYNQLPLKASEFTPEVYRRVYGKTMVPKQYETLGRKIRGFCNQFYEKNILLKDEKSAYSFNFNYFGSSDT